MFSDVNDDGELTESSNPQNNEVIKRDFYYPFGLQMEGGWQPPSVDPKVRHLYNGKEKDEGSGLYDYGARMYDAEIGRWLSVDPLAADYAAWSPYNYTLNNPILLVDPDGRAPENIIIGAIAGESVDNPGHVAVAIEQYDNNGNKTGNVIVFETALPDRIRDQFKDVGIQAGIKMLSNKYPAIYNNTGEEISKADFDKRTFDAKFEFETTKIEDETKTANLTRAVTNEVPYVVMGNNCAKYACSAIPKRFGKNIGVENDSYFFRDYSISTPNQTIKDLTKLAKNNSDVTATKSYKGNVSKLPTAKEMLDKL